MNITKSTDWIDGTTYCSLVSGPRVIGRVVRVGLVWQAYDNSEYLGSYRSMVDAQRRVVASFDFHLLEPKNDASTTAISTYHL